ncbi:hypothetical protein PSI9734_01333 [Pseudidiomarina piscicola]|uniref:Uncharacterized protein n=2 Tax=Pseudidiomarina piscicola TaxID=2614830 RepID=A0A6S6WJP3_9GAMM|nr:hypothetical protein PSI9734_01333 [Pseudidiomarina piscicola]VZT40400.1 hypothetical protein PSI9734_01333 [Pseudomonas aeruginosa]
MNKLGLILVGFLLSFSTMAAQPSSQELANSRTWQKLLHLPNGHSHSEITTPGFFLHDDGHKNPEAELTTTLEALKETPQLACRYPARAHWLAQQGAIKPLNLDACDELQKWLNGQSPNAVSVIFADGFLDNPASFYGHMLIRIDNDNADHPRQLLAQSFNFGARVPDDEDPVTYIVKGLFGGYQAAYSTSHFYRYDINYADAELRNLWSYRLATSEAQSRLLIWHLWELLQTDYTYFFTSRNCAYHMARALELVTDGELVSSRDPFVLPSDVIQRLNQAEINGAAAISQRQFIPSRLYQFQQRWQQLEAAEKQTVETWLAQPETADLSFLDEASAVRVSDVLTDFFTYRLSQTRDDEQQQERLQHSKSRLLRARMQQPMGLTHEWRMPQPSAPQSGQDPSLIRIGMQSLNAPGVDSSQQLTLRFRPTYYDVLQPQQGRLANATLTMGELEVGADDTELQLNSLWLLRLHTLNPSVSGLPGDGGASWGLQVGWQRDFLRQSEQRLSPVVSADYGKAYMLAEQWFNLSLRAELRNPTPELGAAIIAPQLEWIGDFPGARSQCRVRYEIDTTNRLNEPLFAGCEIAFHSAENQDIRIALQHQQNTVMQVAWSWYW